MSVTTNSRAETQSLPNSFQAEVLVMCEYYPWGMEMPGQVYVASDYRYAFNGMERDDDVKGTGDSYDFGARMYDPRVGRWWSRDPMFSNYPSTSPYVPFGDNSLYFIDRGGETLSISTRYVKDSPEYRRLDALRTDMKLYAPGAYDILEKSSVNIVLNEGLPKGLDASRLLGYTDLAMTGITRTEVQPLYQSGYAIGGKIVDIGNLCKERRPLNSDDIGFKDNPINIYINFDLAKSYGDKRDALLGVEQGTSQEKEYLKTGLHEAFGHALYALQNIMQSYIQVSIGPLERPTTRGVVHEVGNEGGRLAEDMDKDVDEKMHKLEQQQGYERIIKSGEK